jgi:murein DD-endopeptidase MepM/ murein hydrolase activator NlpD
LKDRIFKIPRLKKRYTHILYSFLVAVALIVGYRMDDSILDNFDEEAAIASPTYQFGYNVDSVHIHNDVIRKNDFFGAILNKNGLAQNLILLLEHESRKVFNIRNIREGAQYHVIKKHECDAQPIALIYEPDKYKYIVYDFRDSVQVRLVEREVEVCEAEAYGKIESTLWGALERQKVDPAIIDNMEDALSGAVDFYHTQKGDEFKLIYENKYIDGELVGIGRLIAASYTNESGTSHSILYKIDNNEGYFDSEGRPAQRAFLKAPVKFSRISSRYNLRRFHPIRGKTIPHLGTDYAAPHGTPIRSVSDGVVTAASYTGGNGNFVKIRHDNVYETQYLHMSRFAKGIRPGVRVKQGETIGYVGSTGLATGPHVCFRFWKNGRQINHLREKLPAAKPMSKEQLPAYYEHRDKILNRLAQIRNMETVALTDKTSGSEVINP